MSAGGEPPPASPPRPPGGHFVTAGAEPGQAQRPGRTPVRGEAAGPSPGGRGRVLSANRGMGEDGRCPGRAR